MEKKYTLPTVLVIVMALAVLAALAVSAFFPRIILPRLDGANMVLLSVIALVADAYLAPGAKRCWICVPGAAFVCFGIMPFAAGLVSILTAVKLGLMGAALFSLTTALYSAMLDRMKSGPAGKLIPVLSGFGLYLAFQCLLGIML